MSLQNTTDLFVTTLSDLSRTSCANASVLEEPDLYKGNNTSSQVKKGET